MKKEWVYEFDYQRKDLKRRYDGWVAVDVRDFGLGLSTHNRRGSHSVEFSFAFLKIYVAWWVK